MNPVKSGCAGSYRVSGLIMSVALGVCSVANAGAASNGIIPYSLKVMKRDYSGMISRGELVEIKRSLSKVALLANKCRHPNYFVGNRMVLY